MVSRWKGLNEWGQSSAAAGQASNTRIAYNYSRRHCIIGPVNRPLDLEWLEDFLALADTGNFSRGESPGIAQPAFRRHIRAMSCCG